MADGLAPDTFVASNHTEIHSGDLEAIGVYNSSCWTLLGGVGVRYVNLRQNYDVLRTNPGGSPTPGVEFTIDRETSNATHNLDAMGPTLGCEFSRRIGETGFALYGMGRGSLLVGQHRFGVTTERRLRGDILGGIVDNTDRFLDNRTVHDIVPIGELEVGAQYTRDMGHCNLIVRAGFQCQTWIDAGTAIDSSGDLDFYGGTFLIGLQY
ncbi:MAG: Lpg1974 family pore-forming outer membrane protein [Gemmataceae bacterium]